VRKVSEGQTVGGVAPTLESLMEAFIDGDPRAFNQLYERLAPRVCSLLTALSGDRRLAEDLTQTTFLKVHRARDTYARGARLEPWVFAIARRTLLDERRRKKRRPEDLSADGSMPEPQHDDSPEDGRLDPEQERALYARLAALPAPQREAIVLLKVQGLSINEAAKLAGTTAGAMKLRAHRAYEALRAALGHRSHRDSASSTPRGDAS
jgi:RNA polymerase sigma-70 factor (ECF subfamily)